GGGGAYMTCSNDAGGPNITPPDTVTFTAVAHDGAHANYTFDDTYGPGKVGSSLTYTQDYTTADSGKDVAVTVAAANATTPVACGTALHVNTTTNSCGVTLEPIITPDDPRVTPGGSTVIRWHNDNAASCTISRNGVSNWANSSGCVVDDSKTDSGISAATTYCITCDNDTGNTACTTVNVGGLEFEEF
ncbi:MAG TPA: hypothetical protein VM103_02950, partial [Candidatus Paceibacterota bacterium]|nr:hypothetical protein [Candidatus Paceibacterota bacterium]